MLIVRCKALKKVIIRFIVIFPIILILAACKSQPVSYSETNDYVLTEDYRTEAEANQNNKPNEDKKTVTIPSPIMPAVVTPRPARTLGEYAKLPGKIAIITDEDLALESPYLRSYWVIELVERYGPKNVIIYTWSWRNNNYTATRPVAIINEIAKNLDIKVLIINPAIYWTDYIVSILREQRNDIFISYIEYEYRTDEAVDDNQHFRSNTLSDAASNANLILDFNVHEVARIFPEKARELGAKTLVYFYNSYSLEENVKYEESYQHRMMREKCAEIGLLFVEIDINGAIQCGSSYNDFMNETIPPLVEKYGVDIVLFNLDNERVFWSWMNFGFIYLPMYSSYFEPHPIDIARELSIIDYSVYSIEDIYNISHLIEEIKETLEERNMIERTASWPISAHLLFPIAAVEYGIRWMYGEVPEESIDNHVLEQIMVDLITEYTGLQNGVTLTALEENDVAYENYILVLLDYLIY